MNRRLRLLLLAFLASSTVAEGQQEPLNESSCVSCHTNAGLWEEERRRLYVDFADISSDLHWQAGITCHDCHGGDPDVYEFEKAHEVADGFQKAPTAAEVPERCAKCHSDQQYMRQFGEDPWVDQVELFRQSVHGAHLQQTGGDGAATCTSCHQVHRMRPASDPQSPVHPTKLAQTCGKCHEEQVVDLRRGVHETAGETDARGAGTVLGCLACHGGNVHAMLPVEHVQSTVRGSSQVQACGSCHQEELGTFLLSPHAVDPEGPELELAAECSDCHGGHAIYRAADQRSRLHSTHVGETCGRCHADFQAEVAASVHGGEMEGLVEISAARQRDPSCIDCHHAHDVIDPESSLAQVHLTSRCGNCHAELEQKHRLHTHSGLTASGYVPAAGCSECHGAHSILPASHPESRLAGSNRVETCRACHPGGGANFAGFNPHASHHDAGSHRLLHDAHEGINVFVFGVFGLFVVHSGLWFTRSFVPTLVHGRHKRLEKQERAVVRFGPVLRSFYLVLLVCFFGLLVTALPLTYSEEPWAIRLAGWLGGFVPTRVWHVVFAAVVLLVSLAHVLLGMWWMRDARRRGVPWKAIVFGPDSPVPNRRDVRDFGGMIRWFFGRGPKPTFERWAYWEKLDYWAFALTVLVIGLSGLMLWLPTVFALVLPGWTLNLAKMVHSEIAVLAAGLVFVIHLFNMHLRPEKFPIDTSVFTGLVSEEHLRTARPDYLERMQQEGRLDIVERVAPSERYLRVVGWGGITALVVGLLLLAWIFFISLGK